MSKDFMNWVLNPSVCFEKVPVRLNRGLMRNRSKLMVCLVGGVAYGILFGQFGYGVLLRLTIDLPKPLASALTVVAWSPMIVLLSLVAVYGSSEEATSADTHSSQGSQQIDMSWQARLWRGEMPLRKAFWGYYAIGAAVAILVGQFAFFRLGQSSLDRVDARAATIAIFCLAYQVFAAIGVWRSIGRYSGPRRWIGISKFGVILIFLATAFGLALAVVGQNIFALL